MRIAQLVDGSGADGAGMLALQLALGLQSIGHSIVWLADSTSLSANLASKQGLEVIPLPKESSSRMNTIAQVTADTDIINSHYSPSRKLCLALHKSLTRPSSPKLVFTRHALINTPIGLTGLARLRYRHRVAGHICVSQSVYNGLLHSGVSRKRAAVIYGGIDVQNFQRQLHSTAATQAKQQYRKTGRYNIGIVARFPAKQDFQPHQATRKGHCQLFRAVRELLATTHLDCQLLIIGTPPEQNDLIRQVAQHHGLDPKRLTFTGFVTPAASLYACCDVIALPSNEGLGLTLVEGMAAGLPVIGHYQGGTAEIISHQRDGLLINPNDTQAFAEALHQTLTDTNLRHYCSQYSPQKALQSFDIARVVWQTEQCYARWIND